MVAMATKSSHRLTMENICIRKNTFISDWISVKIAEDQNQNIILDEFEFGSDHTPVRIPGSRLTLSDK